MFVTRQGFTLIEMLLVLSIMALVASMTIFGFRRSIESQRVTASMSRLQNDLSYASQLALKDDRIVYIVLEMQEDPNVPASTMQYRGYWLCTDAENPRESALREFAKFDLGIVISSDTHLSTILKNQGEDQVAKSIGFKPDGSTTLPKATEAVWCITFIEEKDLLSESYKGVPKTSRTLVINANTGVVTSY